MPEFDIEIEFEVYCGTCGKGICHLADTRKSHNRGTNQVSVVPCENCMDNAREEAREEAISEMQVEIDALKERIAELEETP
jgi:hypothetical protein